MQVKEIHPQLSEDELDRRICHITDEMLKIAAEIQKKKAEKH